MTDKKLFLVDGAKGHSGTFMVEALLNEYSDCKIIATDLPTDTRKEVMTKETVFTSKLKYNLQILNDPRVEFIPADLTKKETLIELFNDKQYDVIFHPASLYDYFAKLDILRKINVEGTRNLLDLVCDTQDLNKLRFIHWSTCGVYGEPDYKYDKKTKYVILADETAPFNPPNSYNISKMEQEVLLKEYVQGKGLKEIIIRPGVIYGPYQMYGAYHVLLILKMMGHGVVPLLHPKKHRLVYPSIHVADLSRAAILLANKEEAIGEAYNLVGDPVWMDDWLEWVFSQFGMKCTYLSVWFPIFKFAAKIATWFAKKKENKSRKLGVRPSIDRPMVEYVTHNHAFSNKKLKDLGFEFYYDAWKGYKETIDWYIENGWLPTEQNKMEVY
jgi:nucleoside-diphosphate-sugar epimerase